MLILGVSLAIVLGVIAFRLSSSTFGQRNAVEVVPGRLTITASERTLGSPDGNEHLLPATPAAPSTPAQSPGESVATASDAKEEAKASSPPAAAEPAKKEESKADEAKPADAKPADAKLADAKLADSAGNDKNKEPQKPWGDGRPQLIGDTYQMTVTVGPYASLLECDAKTPEAIREVVDQYAEIAAGQPIAGKLTSLDDAFCRQLVKERWEETTQHPFGAMYQLHLLVQFDRKAKERILDACQDLQVEQRLWLVGAAAMGLLGMLAAAYGYLKVTAARRSRPIDPAAPQAGRDC